MASPLFFSYGFPGIHLFDEEVPALDISELIHDDLFEEEEEQAIPPNRALADSPAAIVLSDNEPPLWLPLGSWPLESSLELLQTASPSPSTITPVLPIPSSSVIGASSPAVPTRKRQLEHDAAEVPAKRPRVKARTAKGRRSANAKGEVSRTKGAHAGYPEPLLVRSEAACYSCPINGCDVWFASGERAARDHLEVCHNLEGMEKDVEGCVLCPCEKEDGEACGAAMNPESPGRHLLDAHLDQMDVVYPCPLNGCKEWIGAGKTAAQEHLKVSHDLEGMERDAEGHVSCPCEKEDGAECESSMAPGSLGRHLMDAHVCEELWRCPLCTNTDKSFRRKTSAERHIRDCHFGKSKPGGSSSHSGHHK
ncbi:hypothetical protein B0H21DRAFT_85401 [Amylocystis lapponica]|nr:hypothetical protein B0H21DRAFT_85401 [Amylocystis lapponica]